DYANLAHRQYLRQPVYLTTPLLHDAVTGSVIVRQRFPLWIVRDGAARLGQSRPDGTAWPLHIPTETALGAVLPAPNQPQIDPPEIVQTKILICCGTDRDQIEPIGLQPYCRWV